MLYYFFVYCAWKAPPYTPAVRTANHVPVIFTLILFPRVLKLRYLPNRDCESFPGHEPVLTVVYYSCIIRS